MDVSQIGLQLYTLRHAAAQDLEGTLRGLSEAGYRNVELAGFYGYSAAELRDLLKRYNIRSVSAHVSLKDFKADTARTLEDLQTLECIYAIVPYVPVELREKRAQCEELADTLNHLGEATKEAGLKFCYHNHDFEFAPVEDTTPWQIISTRTDPRLVNLEIDLYWVTFAGLDPVGLLQTYTGRVPLIHLKDMAATEQREFLAVGEGKLPWPRLLQAAKAAGVEWFIVEIDEPTDAFRQISSSFNYLKNLTI